jgi:sulfite reductase alpha subunit-like flavoprotein
MIIIMHRPMTTTRIITRIVCYSYLSVQRERENIVIRFYKHGGYCKSVTKRTHQIDFGWNIPRRNDDVRPLFLLADESHVASPSSFFLCFLNCRYYRLQKSLPKTLFQGSSFRFALFCLGDRAYGTQFCAAGRKLAIRLLQLGMPSFCDVGYGDDMTSNGGVFRDLDSWLEQTVLPCLPKKKKENDTTNAPPIHGGGSMDPSTTTTTLAAALSPSSPYLVSLSNHAIVPPPSDDRNSSNRNRTSEEYKPFFTLSCPIAAYRYDTETGNRMECPVSGNHYPKSPPRLGRLISNERITATDWEQDTRHIVVHVQSTSWASSSEPLSEDHSSLPSDHSATILVPPPTTLSSLPYQAGDIATILPCNSDEAVDEFIKVLPMWIQELADCPMDIQLADAAKTNNSYCHWPSRCTLRGWLKFCADFHSLPEREDLRELSRYCSLGHARGQEQREMLRSLSETKGAALYGDYILREKRSWSEVLYDFDSIRYNDDEEKATSATALSIESLLVLLPPIRPRHFSIASAPSAPLTLRNTAHRAEIESNDRANTMATNNSGSDVSSGFCIELCVAVVEGTTPLGRSYHGLCSKYLSRLIPSSLSLIEQSIVRLWIQPGSFRGLPREVSTSSTSPQFNVPILCVGAGTGIAPLRSLLLERNAILRQAEEELQNKTHSSSHHGAANSNGGGDSIPHDNILLFGCRKQASDYYYRDNWEEITRTNPKHLRVLTAFSRDQVQRIYVQKVLREADGANLICNHILNHNGAVYIAGGPQMARGVKEEIIAALGKVLGNEKQAHLLLAKLQRSGRFNIEAWS